MKKQWEDEQCADNNNKKCANTILFMEKGFQVLRCTEKVFRAFSF